MKLHCSFISLKKSFLILSAVTATSLTLHSPESFANNSMPAIKPGDPLPANAFIELAKIVNPAVVNIFTTSAPRGRRMMNDPFLDMLERFYGFQGPQGRPHQSLGTGFVIREDGLIVTNAHVIQGADIINVQFGEDDKTKHEAIVVGSDERTDLALIKLSNVSKLPVLKLGNSNDVQVGEWVAAFGNPFGQGHTMTKGIISAKGRQIGEINRFPLLQTDTPINPGNSGGPLVNLRGEVIGVNNAINAAAQGMGFAIPIDEVKLILPQLEKFGKVRQGFLGVMLAEIDPTTANQLGLKDTEGALIADVDSSGPAGKAGAKAYDVVIAYNDKKITSATDLMDNVRDSAIGSKAKIKVIRDGKERVLTVELAERPDNPNARRQERRTEVRGTAAPHGLGFDVAEANQRLTREFNIGSQYSDRPVIVNVQQGSPAARAGLRAGDVILDVNRREVGKVEDIGKQLKKGTNTMRVVRGARLMIISLQTR